MPLNRDSSSWTWEGETRALPWALCRTAGQRAPVPDPTEQGQRRPGTGVDGCDLDGDRDPKSDPSVGGGLAPQHGKERTEVSLLSAKSRGQRGRGGCSRAAEADAESRGGLSKAARCASPERAARGERELPVTGGIRAERGRPVLGREAAARLPARAGSPHV